jgi:hypothetical protein
MKTVAECYQALGHVHERWRQRGRMINVGVDAWDCGPASEAELAAMIGGGPIELAPLPSTTAPLRLPEGLPIG